MSVGGGGTDNLNAQLSFFRKAVMTYQPNFAHAKIKDRCLQAINFVEKHANSGYQVSIARTQLYKYFGNTSRPLGQYLLGQLLEVTDPHYNFETGKCKKYRANTAGIARIKEAIGVNPRSLTVAPELVSQLESGEIEYNNISNRSFSSLQYIPREQRSHLLNEHGYSYHYDIQAAAPCLLMQRAQHKKDDLQLPHLSNYIANRSQIRQEIAQECLISQDQVKLVINSILQGAIVTTYHQSKLFRELNQSYAAVAALKSCDQFQSIKADIRLMWQVLRDQFPTRTTITRTGITKRVRVSAREKSQLYRELEDQVGRVIKRLLKRKGVRVLWIHDGWVCNEIVDPNEIVSEVRRQTGYCIQLDWTRYED